MTEREALRLQDQILETPCNLRVDCICPSPVSVGKWELVVTDTRSARQFLVTDPGQLCEYLHLHANSNSNGKPDAPRSSSSKQGLLF